MEFTKDYRLLYADRLTQYEELLAIDVLQPNPDLEQLADKLEKHYLPQGEFLKYEFLQAVGESYALAAWGYVLVSAEALEPVEQQDLMEAFKKYAIGPSKETLSLWMRSIVLLAKPLIDLGGLEEECFSIYYILDQILTKKAASGFQLYDYLELVLDGNAVSNVFRHRPIIYAWTVLDVLPAALEGAAAKYICCLGDFVERAAYLNHFLKKD